MKPANHRLSSALLLLVFASLACQLTSPTPASWSGTPTAAARAATNTAMALTLSAAIEEPLPATPTPEPESPLSSPTPQSTAPAIGPWLVFPAPDGEQITAYDLETGTSRTFDLPAPVILSDLKDSRPPDGQHLIVRAGSALNTDELALYQLGLLSGEVSKVTPLLSINVQRKIVNQEGTQAFDTLHAVTRPGNLVWSPDGRFLAFTAALDNNSSDLYLLDVEKDRIDRLNGVYSHSASPFWSPGSNWLVSVEKGIVGTDQEWRAEVVSGLQIPGYTSQNTFYLPPAGSQAEIFVGWANAQSFISYSQTAEGAQYLRQMNVDTYKQGVIWPGALIMAALDPVSGALAFVIESEAAAAQGLLGGIYLLGTGSSTYALQRAGEWTALKWDSGGRFFALGSQGVYAFSPTGEGFLLSDESWASISPNGNWIVAGGDGNDFPAGVRLYQSASGNRLQSLTDFKADTVLWGPDSKSFFLMAEGTLYRLSFPGFDLETLLTGFPVDLPTDLLWLD